MISIITPSFRQLDWLRLCIASVADQEGVGVEHIVQDAGTPGIAEMFRTPDQFERTKLFVEKDEGMYDAINRGLIRARGEICAYLNSDEQYLEGALARVHQVFESSPQIDILFADAILTNSAGRALSYRRAILPRRFHTKLCHLNTLTCATFFRRSLVERGFLFEPQWKIIGDAVWIDSLLRGGIKMATLPDPLAVYSFTGANLSGAIDSSAAERARWHENVGGPPAILAPIASLDHRLRKWRAGAYRQRSLSYAIYTHDDPQRRRRFHVPKLHYRWPAAAET